VQQWLTVFLAQIYTEWLLNPNINPSGTASVMFDHISTQHNRQENYTYDLPGKKTKGRPASKPSGHNFPGWRDPATLEKS
jgi:hypothetical protein